MSPFLAGLRRRPDRVRRSSHLRACCVRPASISRCTRNPLADADVIFPEADMYVISMNPCSAAGTATAPSPRSARRAWRLPCRSTGRSVPPGARPPRCLPWLRPEPRLPGRIAPALLLPGPVRPDRHRSGRLPLGPAPARAGSRSGRLRPARSARPALPGRLCPAGSARAALPGRLCPAGSARPVLPGRFCPAVSARPARPGRLSLGRLCSRPLRPGGLPRAQAGPPLSPAHGAGI
jgi:hypothetical protein